MTYYKWRAATNDPLAVTARVTSKKKVTPYVENVPTIHSSAQHVMCVIGTPEGIAETMKRYNQ